MRNYHILKSYLLVGAFIFAGTLYAGAAWPAKGFSIKSPTSYAANMAPLATPVAVEDEYSVREGEVLEIFEKGVLENDYDPDGESIYAELVTAPGHHDGTFELGITGSFIYQHDGSEDSEDSFTYWITDSTEYSTPVTVKIEILAVNDAPVLQEISAGNVSWTENASAVVLFPNITISDNESDPIVSATIRFTPGYHAMDLLSYNPLSTGITGSYDPVTGILQLSGSASIAAYQSVLRTVAFRNSGENPTDALRTVTVFVTDAGTENPNSNTLNKLVIVTPVNDAPVLANLETSPLEYTEGSGTMQLSTSITASDMDNPYLNNATVSISSNYQGGEDELVFTTMMGVSGSWNSGSGTLTLTGSNISPETYQAALRTVQYRNNSVSPLTSSRTVTFTVSDGSTPSNQLSRTININSDNSAPELSDIGPAVEFTEGGSSVQLTSTLNVADEDNATLQSATVSITGNFAMNEDLLLFSASGGVMGSYNAATGILTLGGNGTLNAYRNVLRSVRFSNSSQNPVNLSRTITFVVDDGEASSLPAYKTVTITPVNNVPVLAGIEISTLTYAEGDGSVSVTSAITLSDADDTSFPSATIGITNYQTGEDVLSYTPAYGLTGTFNATTGQLSLTGSATTAEMQLALRSVKYSNTSANPSTVTRTISFTVNDGDDNSNTVSRNLSVTAANTAPVLTDPVSTPVNYKEGNSPVLITNTLVVTDEDNTSLSSATISFTSGFATGEDVLTYSAATGITGNYNATTGILSFTGVATKANYQTTLRSIRYSNSSQDPSETNRVLSFIVNDGDKNSEPLLKTVTVEGENDPPVATELTITATNNRIGTLHTATFTYTDPEEDEEGNHVYQWYRSNFANGSGATAITGATDPTYKPVIADGGKYIGFEVTPVDEHDLSGTLVRITNFRLINAAPVASNVRVYAPLAEPGETIKGRFNYTDLEMNPRGNALYTWYRSSVPNPTPASPGTVIPGNDSSYVLKAADADRYFWFEVKPVATAGSSPGDSEWSNVIGPIGKFTANITGSDTVCAGSVMQFTLTITAGKEPFKATLRRTGNLPKDTTISDIDVSPRIINVKIPGTYTLLSLTDANNDVADISESKPVIQYVSPKAKALISGSTSICKGVDTHAPLTLTFTAGTSPYEVTIRRREVLPYNDTVIKDITTNIYGFDARIIGDGPTRHRVIAITDKNGCAGDTASGSAWLKYTLSPIATITGSDSICPGESAKITVTLTSGIPNWSFTYQRDNASPVTIAGITTATRSFTVTQPGTYKIIDVRDTTEQSGCGTGQAIIAYNVLPSAALSGTATICEHTTTPLNVSLTGNSPWKFYYTRNLGDSVLVQNVSSSPYALPVSKAGNYTLYKVSDRNKCSGTVSGSATITVTPAPQVTISGLKQVYNREEGGIDTIIGSPSGGVYAGPGVFSNYFFPSIAPLGTHNITYTYRVSPASCYGYDTAVVSVLETDAVITIENNRTKFCTNDAPFVVTGINQFDVEGFFTITGGMGIQPYGRNTALVTPSLLQPKQYTITYTYMSGGGVFPKDIEIEIGTPPVADFTWATECFNAGQPIAFTNKSTPSFGFFTDTTSYYWKIYTHTGYDEDSSKNIAYTFNEDGRYFVELQVQNSNGCRDTALALFNLRPTFRLNEVYLEDFEDNPIAWDTGKEKTSVNSWRLDKPVRHGSPLHGFPNAHSGEKCWFTRINSYPAPNEKSWVTSPCFDFTGIERPMLTMYIWRLFNSNRDGANMKASADSGKTWTLVGEIGDGINWYNSYGILGQPDNTPVGWSNDNGISNDNNWAKARHSLDFLKGEKQVQFRIFYGSAVSAQNNDGIAFDDFTISSRDKMALIEHFTNSNLIKSARADSILDAMVQAYGSNVVDLQYHTSSPAGDPFYEHNTSVPKARQLYYGLSSVPVAILDGSTDSRHLFDYDNQSRPLDKNAIIVESLENNIFDIRLEAFLNNNILHTEAQIWAKEDVPPTEMSVRIAVVERYIGDVVGNNGDTIFRNVVKAMLPGPGGKTFGHAWTFGQDRRFEESWEVENVYDVNQLRVVAFIQNEQTKEVYQVAYLDSIDFDTSIDIPAPPVTKKLAYYLYPNPAGQYTTVQFNETNHDDLTYQLFNNTGKLVSSGIIPKGTSSEQIYIENLPEGLYLLRLANEYKALGVTKLMISR